LQLLDETLTQHGIVCPKTDTTVASMNGQMKPVLFNIRAYAVNFISTQALRPEMVAAELDALKSVVNHEIEHLTGIGLSSKTDGRDGEIGHRLPPFSGVLSPHTEDCQLESPAKNRRTII
jgi:hypothetical protein